MLFAGVLSILGFLWLIARGTKEKAIVLGEKPNLAVIQMTQAIEQLINKF